MRGHLRWPVNTYSHLHAQIAVTPCTKSTGQRFSESLLTSRLGSNHNFTWRCCNTSFWFALDSPPDRRSGSEHVGIWLRWAWVLLVVIIPCVKSWECMRRYIRHSGEWLDLCWAHGAHDLQHVGNEWGHLGRWGCGKMWTFATTWWWSQ